MKQNSSDHSQKKSASLRQQLLQYMSRLDAISFRERIIMTVLIAVLIMTLFQLLFFDPIKEEQLRLSQRADELNHEIQSLWDQADSMRLSHDRNPNVLLQARMEKAGADLAQLHQAIDQASNGLLGPEQVPTLLRNLVESQPGLRLVRVETLPVSRVDREGRVLTLSDQTSDMILYRHALELEVKGTYRGIYAWLSAIEKSPVQLRWEQMEYRVIDTPIEPGVPQAAKLVLRIYTLSTQEIWLRV